MPAVALPVSRCSECGFENPRRWVSCARCGHLLGPGLGQTVTRRLSTITRNISLSNDELVEVDGEASTNEENSDGDGDDKTRLFHVSTTIDARPLVGQDAAVGTLRQQIDLAFSERRVTLTHVQGGAGMGRTRLLERASELAARQWLNTRVCYAACRSHDDGPYAPFSRYLLERFGVTPASSPSQVRADMLSTVTDALPDASADEARELTHLLGHIAAIPFPDSPILAALTGSPDELHERACQALLQLLQGDARTRPLLLLLDDMQRAEADAFALIERLLASPMPMPIAIVVAGDESIAPQVAKLAELAPTHIARIQPLRESDIVDLVTALMPRLHSTPDAFVSALCHRSQGNPSALRELIRVSEERGLFVEVNDALEIDMARFERGELPLTLSDAVRARLAALPAHELMVMQWAAVVGELFWDGALLAIARFESARPAPQIDPILRWTQAQDELRLAEALEQLELKGFVVRLGDPVRPGLCEYTFPVAGTRSIVYAELPESSCRARHAIVARWIRLATPLAKEGAAATLGLHLERAGQAAEAARAYLTASAEERARLRTTMALRYAQKALSLTAADETGGRIEALHEVGSLLATLGQYPQATAAFSEIVELAWKLGARGAGGAALNRLARIHRQRGEHGSALEYLHRALLLFRDAHDERGIASTYDDMAQVHRSLGDLEPALGAAEQALAARRSMQDARGEAVSLTTIGLIELDRGRLALARQHFEAALDVRQRGDVSDPEGVLQTEIGLGRLEFHEGSPPSAIERFAVALERAREMNHRQLQSRLLLCSGEAQLALGAIERAQQLLLEARALAGSLRDQKALTEVELQLGLCALAHDDGSAAQKLTAALTLAREHGTRETIATAHRAVARVRARTLFDQDRVSASDDASAAESSFRESIRIFEESGNAREAARTRAELGYHLVERGAGERARAALGEAYAALKPLALPDLARVTETLEQL